MPGFGEKSKYIYWYQGSSIFRWSGANFGSKSGPETYPYDPNLRIECAKLNSPQCDPDKKIRAGPRGVLAHKDYSSGRPYHRIADALFLRVDFSEVRSCLFEDISEVRHRPAVMQNMLGKS